MKITIEQRFFLLILFIICFSGAILINPSYCPDEAGRQLLTNYITSTGKLPTGDESETMIRGWGFSYALRPYLSAMVNSLFMGVIGLFTQSAGAALAASRLCSVLSIVGSFYYCSKIGNILFPGKATALVLPVIVCFIPQVLFVGMFQNNDALGLFAVCMESYWLIKGYQDNWSIGSCVWIGVSMSIAVLTSYVVYPWVLFGGVFCIMSCMNNPSIEDKRIFIAKRTLLILSIIFVLCGWFFIRNGILHDGDFLGITYEKVSRSKLEEQGYSVIYQYMPGYEIKTSFLEFLKEWIIITGKSFVGVFGYMTIYMAESAYKIYQVIVLGAVLLFVPLFFTRKNSTLYKYFSFFIIISGVTVTFLSLLQSYFRDYQPQGRYIISLALLIGFAVSYELNCLDTVKCNNSLNTTQINNRILTKTNICATAVMGIWLCLCSYGIVNTMSEMLV